MADDPRKPGGPQDPERPGATPVFNDPVNDPMQAYRQSFRTPNAMRFDSGGREEPLQRQVPWGERLSALADWMGLALPGRGGVVYYPSSAADRWALYDRTSRNASKAVHRVTDPSELADRAQTARVLKKMPKETVDFTKAEPIFKTEPIPPSSSGWESRGKTVTQSYHLPGGKDPVVIRDYTYYPEENYVGFARARPEVSLNPQETSLSYNQALKYMQQMFGHTEPPSYSPMSQSRMKLFQRQAPMNPEDQANITEYFKRQGEWRAPKEPR